jgi:hypothetical protein
LRAPLALYDSEPITVRDVIKYAANVSGGVHTGAIRESGVGQKRLKSLRDSQSMSLPELAEAFGLVIEERALPGGLGTVLGLGRVIVRGLKPLYDGVCADVEGQHER